MAYKKSKNIFSHLNNCTKNTYDDNPPNLFSDIDNTSWCDYWLFSDLYNLFGPMYIGNHNDIDITGRAAITKHDFNTTYRHSSKQTTPTFYDFYNGHVATFYNNYAIMDKYGTMRNQNGPDAKLTRYACWAFIHQWPQLIFAQTYFMMPSVKFDELYNNAYQYARIALRTELAHTEHIIHGIAHRNHANMRQFNYYINRAFFYGRDTNDIKCAYGIPLASNDPLANYMGSYSLAARSRGMRNAIAKIDTTPNMRFEKFSDILYDELVAARVKMIKETNIAPEQDIFKKSVASVSRQLKNTEQQFIQKFALQNLQR